MLTLTIAQVVVRPPSPAETCMLIPLALVTDDGTSASRPKMYSLLATAGQLSPSSKTLQASMSEGMSIGKRTPSKVAEMETMSLSNCSRGVKLTRAVKVSPLLNEQVSPEQLLDSTQFGVGFPPEQALKLTRPASAAKTRAKRMINLNIFSWIS